VEEIELSGPKRRNIRSWNKQNKNIRDLYGGISEFKKHNELRSNLVKDGMVICLKILTIFWTDGRISSVGYWMYMTLKMLCRQKCIQLSH